MKQYEYLLDDTKKLKRKLSESTETASANKRRMQQLMLENMRNHDNCDACGGLGQFLCCDACPNAFHFACVEPPMNAADVEKITGKWFCRECEYRQGMPIENIPGGLFKQLVESVCTTNPKSYVLPEEVISYFEGVSLDDEGNYVDTSQLKTARNKNGILGKLDLSTLKDKDGNFFQCYRCRKTAVKKVMISCDYCSLFWHLDCLNPPMAAAPSSNKKWKCPNHADFNMKPTRKQRYPHLISTSNIPCLDKDHFNISINDENQNTTHDNKQACDPYINGAVANIDVITNKNGTVYLLPEEPVQFNMEKSQDDSTTTSEVSTPTTFLHSPKQNKEEINIWLDNIAQFHSGHYRRQQTILSLIRDIKKDIPNKIPKTPAISKDISEKRKKYKEIEELLKQKDENYVTALICDKIKQ